MLNLPSLNGINKENMNRFLLALGLCAALCAAFLSCGGKDGKESVAALCAGKFAYSFFNFRYVDALACCTDDSRRVLEFCASNMTAKMIDSLRNITDTPTVSVVETTMLNDSEAECVVDVENGIYADTIGGWPVPGQDRRSYRFSLVKEGEDWKVRMADLPRSGK